MTRVAFVVNGAPGSAMGERAEAFASRLANRFDCSLVFRAGGKAGAAARMLRDLAAARPRVCYVLDLAAAGVAAAGLYQRATGTPFVVDTGDSVVDLGRALGRGPLGLAATRALEVYALRAAAAVVVRGTYHRELLARRGVKAEFIPDGVDVDRFAAPAKPATEANRPLVVGLVGSSVWIESRQTCYGSELVELIRRLKATLPMSARGVLIGDGSGIEMLRRRCEEFGMTDSIDFAGRVPHPQLPGRLREFDICLSTQTDDEIGRVRTTGKLPLYLAAGRFVLASRVGEAARVLPPEMLVEFRGSVDLGYPVRLAERVESLVAARVDFRHRPECAAIARANFDYDKLTDRVAGVIGRVLSRPEAFSHR